MPVLEEKLLFLVYCFAVNKFIYGKEAGSYEEFLKGAAVAVVTLIVLIVINVICNMNGHELDSVLTGTVASVCAMLLYGGLTKNEKNKDV